MNTKAVPNARMRFQSSRVFMAVLSAMIITAAVPAGAGQIYLEESASWKAVQAMPRSRSGFAVGVLNDALYVVGGGGNEAAYYMPRFDGVNWSVVQGFVAPPNPQQIPPFPDTYTRTGLAAGVLNNALYIIGGHTPWMGVHSGVLKYDGTNWTGAASLPVARVYLAVATLNGAVYAVGGSDGSSSQTNVYRFSGTSWTEVASLPAPRSALAAAVLNSVLYAIGGSDGTSSKTNVFRYDGTNWAEVAGLPAPRTGLAAGVLNGSLYAIDGSDGSSATTNVFRFDGTRWTEVSGLPQLQSGLVAGILNGALYAIGASVSLRLTTGRGVTPPSGDSAGGYPVTITGTNLCNGSDVTNVTLCGLPAARVITQSSTQVTVIASALGYTLKNGDVLVESATLGASRQSNAFSYIVSGPLLGGNNAVISNMFALGNGNDITNVKVAGVSATRTGQGSNWVGITLPVVAPFGLKDIVVQSASRGATLLSDAYMVNPPGGIGQDWACWQEVAGLPAARSRLAAGVLNGALYAVGGRDDSGYRTNVFRFDGSIWTEVAGLPAPRSWLATDVIDDLLYAVGGSDGSSKTNVFRFDGSTWTEVAGLPAPRQGLAAAVLNGALYAIGGRDGSTYKANVYRYNATNWIEVAALPQARGNLASGILNGAMYAIGGYSGGVQTNVYRFNESIWTEVAGLPTPREGLAAAVLNGALYAIGGRDENLSVKDNVYQCNGVSWQEQAGFPKVRAYCASGVLNGALYAIGGYDGSTTGMTNVYRYPCQAGIGTGVNPLKGSRLGSYPVVLTGANLCNGSDVTNVTLCGVAVTNIMSQSPTQIVVWASPTGSGLGVAGDVVVQSVSVGTTTKANAFTYGEDVTITVVGSPNGTVTPSGMANVPFGGQTNFLVVADSRYRIESLLTNGVHVSGSPYSDDGFTSTNYVWDNIVAAGTLAVTFMVNRPTLQVLSLYGTCIPAAGAYTNDCGTVLTNMVNSPDTQGTTQYVCVGWTGTGSISNGTGTNVVVPITNDSSLIWLWRTNFWLTTTNLARGAVVPSSGWQANGSNVPVTATPSSYYHFERWAGAGTNSITQGSMTATTILVQVGMPMEIMGLFGENLSTNGTPEWWLAEHGLTNRDWAVEAVDDQDHDGMLTWEEWVAGCDPTNMNSVFRFTSPASVPGQGMVVCWPSISNRFYDLSRTTNLLMGSNSFTILPGASSLPASPPLNAYTDSAPNLATAFYRVSALLTNATPATTNGLLAYYPFNGNATDESGNGHNGLIHGNPIPISGPNGTAYWFDGTNDYIDIGTGINPSVFTLAAWIRWEFLANPGNAQCPFLSKIRNTSPYYRNFEFAVQNDGRLFMHIPNGGAWNARNSVSLVSSSSWAHVAMTYDGTVGHMYINGVQDETSYTGGYAWNDWSVNIGKRPYSSGSPEIFYRGGIDEVRIYNRALSASEVQQLRATSGGAGP